MARKDTRTQGNDWKCKITVLNAGKERDLNSNMLNRKEEQRGIRKGVVRGKK